MLAAAPPIFLLVTLLYAYAGKNQRKTLVLQKIFLIKPPEGEGVCPCTLTGCAIAH